MAQVGRYALFDRIAEGGMATVHFARLQGQVGFSRGVAVKRLLPNFAADPDFVAMFVDEARLASRVRHANVVQTLDVVAERGEVFVVMEYVHGEPLFGLLRGLTAKGRTLEPRHAAGIMVGVLHGLHAAHQAHGEDGRPLHIVHRDVSPQNILVGVDGVARVLDFGVARASARLQGSRDGELKGKLAYMAPEQLRAGAVGPWTDVYAAGVVLWEALAGRRLFVGDSEGAIVEQVQVGAVDPPGVFNPAVDPALDALVMRALEVDAQKRVRSADELARALDVFAAPSSEIAALVKEVAADALAQRAKALAAVEANRPSGRVEVLSEVAATDPRSRRGPALALAVAAVLVLVAAVALVMLRPPPVTPVAPAAVAVPVPPPAPVAVEAPPPAVAAPPEPAASPARARKRTERAAAKDCDPPFRRDAAGVVIWKRECL